AMMAGFNILNGQRLFRFCMIIFLCSFIAIPVSLEYFDEIYPRLVTPIVIFILFIPYYKNKNRFIILAVAIVSVAIALGWRANVLRILLSFPFLLIYYFRRYIASWFLTLLQVAFFVVPLYFLVQGIKGDSIFAKNSDAEFNITANGEEENLAADTRTDLYTEVLSDLYYSRDIWLGRGSNGKYKTNIYDDVRAGTDNERPNVEVGFLKILINTGVLGMLLYTLLLGLAAYYGTWKSNNTLTKMLSMFLVSHWTMLFMENLIEYSMYFYFSWIVVGLCFSKKFRSMTDAQIKTWLRTPHKRNS
ncbi:MAG TPA: O-antigen ligase family protein, partial [Chitinophagaceae bacterium]|nr:O-antigen ligase family protein [Chitinophagaceae bacterium]